MFIVPTTEEFKSYFTRDFPYGDTNDTVMDEDISKAITQAGFNFNPALFETQEYFSMAYLYLSAHYLVMDLRMASQGIAGQYSWLQASKSVGSVSEGFAIPQRILDNPLLAMYSKSQYGAKYLSLMLPLLNGNVFTVGGATLP